ncbi:putative membrane transport solute-binding protein, partial [Neisseria meningitidis NM233]
DYHLSFSKAVPVCPTGGFAPISPFWRHPMLRLTALTLCTVLALGACSPKDSDSAPQAKEQAVSAAQSESASVTVKTARGDVQIPQNPERIAVYDLGMLDTLN